MELGYDVGGGGFCVRVCVRVFRPFLVSQVMLGGGYGAEHASVHV
jgi:hypothetical protein